jgi:hypothetical protein
MDVITRIERDAGEDFGLKLTLVCECESYQTTVDIMTELVALKWHPQCDLIHREGHAQVKVTSFESVFRLIQWPTFHPTEFFRIIIHTKNPGESDLLVGIIERITGDQS